MECKEVDEVRASGYHWSIPLNEEGKRKSKMKHMKENGHKQEDIARVHQQEDIAFIICNYKRNMLWSLDIWKDTREHQWTVYFTVETKYRPQITLLITSV